MRPLSVTLLTLIQWSRYCWLVPGTQPRNSHFTRIVQVWLRPYTKKITSLVADAEIDFLRRLVIKMLSRQKYTNNSLLFGSFVVVATLMASIAYLIKCKWMTNHCILYTFLFCLSSFVIDCYSFKMLTTLFGSRHSKTEKGWVSYFKLDLWDTATCRMFAWTMTFGSRECGAPPAATNKIRLSPSGLVEFAK